jgi:hypothetical protein
MKPSRTLRILVSFGSVGSVPILLQSVRTTPGQIYVPKSTAAATGVIEDDVRLVRPQNLPPVTSHFADTIHHDEKFFGTVGHD